jgi:hypothetical protein
MTIRYSTKMGYTAMPDEKFKGTVLEAKAHALAKMNGDVYTISIEDKKNKMIFHYGYTGVSLGSNKN